MHVVRPVEFRIVRRVRDALSLSRRRRRGLDKVPFIKLEPKITQIGGRTVEIWLGDAAY